MTQNDSVPVLSMENLTIIREKTRILAGVSWQIRAGEHWAILGANGSGKTSMLSAMTGYLTPTSGLLEVLGQHYGASNWPELRKRIGIVSSALRQQMAEGEPALVTVVSGKYAMIDYWGELHDADLAEARQILRQMDCEHLAERPWLFLSQGERQRVLIGRALMARPELLILDEPCSGLDPVARGHFLRFIDRMIRRKEGPTLILVTHHVEEIVGGISHVLVLRRGERLAGGERAAILTEKTLSEAFGEPVELIHHNGGVSLVPGGRSANLFGVEEPG